MKITRAAGVPCVILLMALSAEIAFTGRYHVIPDSMERDAGVWEESVSDMAEESISGMQDQEDIALQNGDYAEALEMLKGKADVIGDINFDGYPDIKIYDSEKKERSYFLWDEAESQFVRAVILAEEMEGIYIEKRLDEFKTFWGYGDVRDDEYRLLEMTEKMYQWDDIVLKEVRSISCRFEEEESDGDAEQRVEAENHIFASDIDNDGTVEKYEKQINDHYGIVSFWGEMEDWAETGTKEPIIPDCRDKSGREIMMWVDACDGKNIMNVMYETSGLYSYMAEGFCPDDAGGCSDLYAIERKTDSEVETVRTWELPGKRNTP